MIVFVVLRVYGGWGGTELFTSVHGVYGSEAEASAQIVEDEQRQSYRDDISDFTIYPIEATGLTWKDTQTHG